MAVRRRWKRRWISCLAGGKPNEYLDKKNLQPHKLLPEQREDVLNFLRSLISGLHLEQTATTAEISSNARCTRLNLQIHPLAKN